MENGVHVLTAPNANLGFGSNMNRKQAVRDELEL